LPRPQFQIRHLMFGVAGCALLAAGLRASEEWRGMILVVGGPAFGSLIHQSMGGRGMVGGAIGGGIAGFGFGIYASFWSGPSGGDLIGPILGIPLFSLLLAAIGFVVGAVIWGLRIQVEDRDARYPWWSTTEPESPKREE
jgi:hypothetical protein